MGRRAWQATEGGSAAQGPGFEAHSPLYVRDIGGTLIPGCSRWVLGDPCSVAGGLPQETLHPLGVWNVGRPLMPLL